MAGALAGGANATLCYLQLPVPIQVAAVNLHWHIIPAGCAHGALLALVAVAASEIARGAAYRVDVVRGAFRRLVGRIPGVDFPGPLGIGALDCPVTRLAGGR